MAADLLVEVLAVMLPLLVATAVPEDATQYFLKCKNNLSPANSSIGTQKVLRFASWTIGKIIN